MPEQRYLFDRGGTDGDATILRDEEPTYRLFAHGSSTLSDSELVAIVTGRPIKEARTLLQDGLPMFARRAWGIGARHRVSRSVAARIAASLELGRRIAAHIPEHVEVSPATLGLRLATKYGDAVREHFGAVFLTTRSTIIAERELSVGTLDHALIAPRDVLVMALEFHAAAIIVYHCHPSGAVQPSREDLTMTRQLKEAAKLLGVELVDHLIVAKRRYYSMHEHGDL